MRLNKADRMHTCKFSLILGAGQVKMLILLNISQCKVLLYMWTIVVFLEGNVVIRAKRLVFMYNKIEV